MYSIGCELDNRLTFNELNSKAPLMTFILGSRCKDGVVLIADRKITLTNEIGSITFGYKQKLFGILRHVVFGSSGSTDTFEFFRDYIMDQARSDTTLTNVTTKLAEIVSDINKKYGFKPEISFDLLVAVQPPNDSTTLTWISTYGSKRLINDCHAIGIGRVFTTSFLENLWQPDISMEKAAVLGWFFIKYIEDFKLHSSVGVNGGYPQIQFIPDNEKNENGEKVDYEVNPQTRPELFEKIRKDVFKRFNKQKKSMKW